MDGLSVGTELGILSPLIEGGDDGCPEGGFPTSVLLEVPSTVAPGVPAALGAGELDVSAAVGTVVGFPVVVPASVPDVVGCPLGFELPLSC